MRFFVVVLLISAFHLVEAETPCSADLKNGRFQKILANSKKAQAGEVAWARFYLISDRGTHDVALKAHQGGDILGSFIVLKCHRGGIGVKKNDVAKAKLNFELRTKLEKIPKPNAIENYMLSYLLPGNALGIVTGDDPDKMMKDEMKSPQSRWIYLNASANAGFAQAMDEVGVAMQKHDERSSFEWYQKAANAGLASGMKNLGFLYAVNPKLKDAKKASTWTRKAARAGDVYAMVNMGAFVDKKVVDNLTIKEAQSWINTAQKSGHSLGYLEKGLALLIGNYQFPIDKKAGMALLQKAAQTGDSFSLGQISMCYEEGFGLNQNLQKAAEFAEAAYTQGDVSAARKLARIYANLAASYPSLLAKTRYWNARGMSESVAHAIKLDENHPAIAKALTAIDPNSLIVD